MTGMQATPATATPVSTRASWQRPVVGAVVVGLVAAAVAARVSGAAAPLVIADPGPVVRWGLPLVRVVNDVAASATVGLLVFAAFLTPETTRTNRRVEATRLAGLAALLWAAAAAVGVLFTFADLAGIPLSDTAYLPQLTSLLFDIEVTRVQVISLGAAILVAVVAAFATSRDVMAWLAALSAFGVVILALTGHAAGSASHEEAVNAMGGHLLGISVWLGGLIALIAMRPRLGRDLGVTVGRYSKMAGWAFALVALSGLQSAWLRLGSVGALDSRYGALVIVKVTVLCLLGVAGWYQRRILTDRLGSDPADGRAFGRLAMGELLLMGLAAGVAVVLGRTAPPVPDRLPAEGRVLELTGYPDPGRMLGSDWLTVWRIDWLFLAIAVVMVGLYVGGVLRLRRRGDRWSTVRTVSWVTGWVLFVYFTCGAPGIWGRVLFSTHMVMHMGIAMLVPLLLVPATPITLALRSLPARRDKSWGPREVILQVVHSRALRALANPIVASVLFFVSLAVFYYSPLFELALRTHTGHLLMIAHFFLTGYLFVWVLVGEDPGPRRWQPLFLMVILFATISFHAFFGVAITGSTSLLAPDFFGALHLPWMSDPLADQRTAGQIAWGVGEFPTLVLALLVALAWLRSDRAETVRRDRQADRDGEAELAAYNAYLAQRKAHFEREDRR